MGRDRPLRYEEERQDFRALGNKHRGALLTSPSLAQSHQSTVSFAVCEQVRQAIAAYGYAAVKQYALAQFGKKQSRHMALAA